MEMATNSLLEWFLSRELVDNVRHCLQSCSNFHCSGIEFAWFYQNDRCLFKRRFTKLLWLHGHLLGVTASHSLSVKYRFVVTTPASNYLLTKEQKTFTVTTSIAVTFK